MTGPMVEKLTDPSDVRLDDYRRLNDVRFRRRFEAEHRVFIGEGPTVVARLLESALTVRSVLCLESMVPRLSVDTTPVFLVDRDLLAEVVGFDLHRGIVAAASRPQPRALDEVLGGDSLLLVEGVNDHENLGSIIRAAVGLGAGGVVLDPTTADPWYRRSVRVSMGAIFSVPIVRSVAWRSDLETVRRSGFTLVAMTPAGNALSIWETHVDRPAVMVGAEGPGLSDQALGIADVWIRIPMHGVDSLNVGHAAAIACAVLFRNRTEG